MNFANEFADSLSFSKVTPVLLFIYSYILNYKILSIAKTFLYLVIIEMMNQNNTSM